MQRPKPQPTIYILASVSVAGIVAQLIAAHNAFDLLGRGQVYAWAAAILIEVAAVAEALVFARSGDKVAGLLLLVAVLVSGIYNYAQANAAAPDLAWWIKWALALGPLAAMTSIGLLLGAEWAEYEDQVATYTLAIQQEADEARRAEDRTRADDVQWQRRMEWDRQQRELKENALARRRQERWEHKQAQRTGQVAQLDRTETDQEGQPVRWWPDKKAFLSDPDRPTDLTPADVVRWSTLTRERSARRWLNAVNKNGKDHA